MRRTADPLGLTVTVMLIHYLGNPSRVLPGLLVESTPFPFRIGLGRVLGRPAWGPMWPGEREAFENRQHCWLRDQFPEAVPVP